MDFLAAGNQNRAVFGAIITKESNGPSRVGDWRTEAEGFVQRMRVQTNLQRAEIAMEGKEAWAARVRADRAANPMSDAARVRPLIRLGRANRREMADEARTAMCVALARANEAVDGGSDYVVARELAQARANVCGASQDGNGAGRNQGLGDSGGFTGIGDRVEAGHIPVAITEGEIESQVKAVEAAGVAVQSTAAVFNANDGFSRPLRASTLASAVAVTELHDASAEADSKNRRQGLVDVEDDARPCSYNATSDEVNKDPVKQYMARADVFDDSDSGAEIDAKPDPHPELPPVGGSGYPVDTVQAYLEYQERLRLSLMSPVAEEARVELPLPHSTEWCCWPWEAIVWDGVLSANKQMVAPGGVCA
jgi:hypothetical protein